LHWGELHTAGEVKLSWHTPTEEEVNFALEALESVAGPALDKLEQLVEDPNPVTKEWRNDFNRYNNLVRNGLAGVASLTVVLPPQELGQQLTDVG
jgi:proteasome activator subunit 4